jgi:hypothetical protein
VRPLTAIFVLGVGCALVPAVMQIVYSITALSAGTRSSGHTVTQQSAGELLTDVAIVVLVLSQGFVVWATWMRPSAMVGGLSFLRRAQRKINGAAPYGTDTSYGAEELRELRSLAAYRVALSNSRAVSWATRVGAVAVLALFVGGVVGPPTFGPGEAAREVIRCLCVVFALLGVAAIVQSWRTSNDVKARAFLDRTESVGKHADP